LKERDGKIERLERQLQDLIDRLGQPDEIVKRKPGRPKLEQAA